MERRLSEFFTPETAEKAGMTAREGGSDPMITGLEYDSRLVKPGNLFFALSGLHTDGHLYINEAIAKGAAAVVCEADKKITDAAGISDKTVVLKVKNSRFAMSPVASAFYNFPSRHLCVIGVTGTEGKSTTVSLIWQLLRLLGKKAGFISTVQHSLGDEALDNTEHQTTPEATAVQRMLREMADNGCEYAVLEASSHGLSPRTNRLGGIQFCCAVFTNVTHEHLEFHGTFEQYRDDKANLFRALDDYANNNHAHKPFGIINIDDKSADYFAKATQQKTAGFSAKGKEAALSLKSIESSAWGNWYDVAAEGEKDFLIIRDRLPGAFNAGNVLAALLAVSGVLELPVNKIAALIPGLKPVRGRMNAIDKGQPFEVVVDYAHTPSSFNTIFPPLRKRLNKKGGRIISVFGSAGERDTQKRPEQGKIAAEYSDIIILTDEDPRGEKPMDILEEIARGVETEAAAIFKRGENLFLIPDRPAAIRRALSLARPGDLVLLLGKSHENSIIYADHVMPFDEIAETEKALGEMGWK